MFLKLMRRRIRKVELIHDELMRNGARFWCGVFLSCAWLCTKSHEKSNDVCLEHSRLGHSLFHFKPGDYIDKLLAPSILLSALITQDRIVTSCSM